ncbi:thiopeptide-type bacteriocin biosynthesis protein [Streptomyces clavifer]|uniref:thiopeptide-type bacteriocin biosynthesis protein n=1 Tax=Streptomyces clavifer TaxID=68188 RepID=UPI00381C5AF3
MVDSTATTVSPSRSPVTLRLRLHPEPKTKRTLGDSFDRLVSDGHLQRWWPGIYEPETAAFGGPASMTAAHALFATDSREAPQLRQRGDLAVGPRELSVLLCTIMMRAAGLEWYEQGTSGTTSSRKSTDQPSAASQQAGSTPAPKRSGPCSSPTVMSCCAPAGWWSPSPSGPPPSAARGRKSAVPFRTGRWTAG